MPQTAADAAKAKQEAKQEAERQAAERLKAALKERITEMKLASPSEAEKSHEWVKKTCTDTRVPPDFKKWALDQARKAECASNMRATDSMLEEAVRLAQLEKLKERSLMLNKGREYYAKACSLGCPEEFKTATQRLIDTAMMSGGVYVPGAFTKAKPKDFAPKNPRSAKGDGSLLDMLFGKHKGEGEKDKAKA